MRKKNTLVELVQFFFRLDYTVWEPVVIKLKETEISKQYFEQNTLVDLVEFSLRFLVFSKKKKKKS